MFVEFLKEFLGVFAKGLIGLFVSTDSGYGGILGGLYQMFNVPQYMNIINAYKEGFGIGEWIGLAAIILVLVGLLIGLVILLVKGIIRIFRRGSYGSVDSDLLDEVERLNKEIKKKDKKEE